MATRRRGESVRKVLSDEAIVLKVTPVGEGDGIVHLLTREHGKVRASARRIRSARGALTGRFEILNRLAIRYEDGRDLARIDGADILASSFVAASDPARLPFAAYLAELADEMLPDRDPAPRVFRLVAKGAMALGAGVPPRQVARYVEYWILRLSGHVPDETECGSCGKGFLTGNGTTLVLARDGIVCASCAKSAGEPQMRFGATLQAAIKTVRSKDVLRLSEEPMAEGLLRALQVFNRALLLDVLGREPRSAVYLRRYGLDAV